VLVVEVVLGDTIDDEVEVVVLLVDAEVLVVFFDRVRVAVAKSVLQPTLVR